MKQFMLIMLFLTSGLFASEGFGPQVKGNVTVTATPCCGAIDPVTFVPIGRDLGYLISIATEDPTIEAFLVTVKAYTEDGRWFASTALISRFRNGTASNTFMSFPAGCKVGSISVKELRPDPSIEFEP
jgi:hypothetical protein